MDFSTTTDSDLAKMMQTRMGHMDILRKSATEKFKQADGAIWNEALYEEGVELLGQVRLLLEELRPIGEELERRVGPTLLEEQVNITASRASHDDQRWYRRDLTTQTVPVTRTMDELLPQALENVLGSVSSSWWRHQQALVNEEHRNTVLQPLILCGRERWGATSSTLNRFAHYLHVVDEHIRGEPLLDIYTAARAVPQIFTLGMSLQSLKEVDGADLKLRELCRAPNGEVDSRIFELLVAAAFARLGHEVSFIQATAEKSPDLRLHGEPIPIVVECKRKQALNAYEMKEFTIIREVFSVLCEERERLGLIGELTLDFKQELVNLAVGDIVKNIRDLTNSLSLYATKETEWGTVALRPVSLDATFEPTRLYGPDFLNKVFGIDLESDEFDGICVVVKNNRTPVVDRADLPFLMKWMSNSEAAKEKRLQTIKTLWIEAVEQVPTGEAGLIYLAYEEGHRPSLADARTDAIRELASTIYFKRRAIVIPMTLISRLFPNLTYEGRPDLIESAIPLVDGDKANYDFWTGEMPTSVFTPRPEVCDW